MSTVQWRNCSYSIIKEYHVDIPGELWKDLKISEYSSAQNYSMLLQEIPDNL